MKAIKGKLIFSTGKVMHANCGIIGLSASNEVDYSRSVFVGYDDHIPLPEENWVKEKDRLTSEECVELANEMLNRWIAFRDRYDQTSCHHCGKVIDNDWAREHDNLCVVCSVKQNGPDK